MKNQIKKLFQRFGPKNIIFILDYQYKLYIKIIIKDRNKLFLYL